MSLRIFHIVFITASVLLCLFGGVWGVRGYVANHDAMALGLGVLFLACGVALIVYGARTFRKLKEIS